MYSIGTDTATATAAKSQLSYLTPNMKYYQDYLKYRYEAMELTSPDEMLDCFSPQYIDLTLIKNNKNRTIKLQSKQNVVKQGSDLDYVTLSEALDVEGEKKKIILIEGSPGMGKTTLAIHICKCWAKDELLQSYDAVILITLRDPEIQEAKTIGDLLLMRDDELRDIVFKEIMKSYGEKICFIFEGFDELPDHLRKSSVFAKIMEDLPKCTLIYTSRPQSCMFFHTQNIKIKINGFAEESINEYISKTFENATMALSLRLRVMRLNIEYYFWWRDDCFGLLIHHNAQFHFMVSISDEYKYKRLVKTTFKSCGKLIFLELYHTRN